MVGVKIIRFGAYANALLNRVGAAGLMKTIFRWETEFERRQISDTPNRKSGAGGILKADFIWAVIPYLGLGFGGFANLNSVQSTVGLEFKMYSA
jgi:hypothetical protein